MIDEDLIGKEELPVYVEIEKGAIKKFAIAINDKNPIYHDEDIAREKGFSSIVAPLTFPTTFRNVVPTWYAKLDKSKLLHGEQEYKYKRRLCAGETIKYTDKLTDKFVKQGKNGKLTFIIREKMGFDLDDKLVFVETQTLVVRE